MESLVKDGAISTGSGKAHQCCQNLCVKVWGCDDASSSGRAVPSQPDALWGFDALCKRCDVCVAAKDRRLKSGWTLLLEFFFLSFSLLFWQVVCAWAVLAAQDGIGLLQYDSSTVRAGLTDLAGVQRGASGVAGHRPAGFTGGGSLHPAKYVATGGGTKQPRTRRGCGAERNGLGVPREVGSNGLVSARKKYPVLLNQHDPPSEGKKVLVECGLFLWEDLPVARGGMAWESPTQGGFVVLQER